MCAFTTDFDRAAAGFSPDRCDALVWAFSELMVEPMAGQGFYDLAREHAEALEIKKTRDEEAARIRYHTHHLVDAAIDAHANPIRQIDLDYPDALRQCRATLRLVPCVHTFALYDTNSGQAP
jgi:hypothetical protein